MLVEDGSINKQQDDRASLANVNADGTTAGGVHVSTRYTGKFT